MTRGFVPRVVGELCARGQARAPGAEPFSEGSASSWGGLAVIPRPGPPRAAQSSEERQLLLERHRDRKAQCGDWQRVRHPLGNAGVCGSLAPPLRLSWWVCPNSPWAITTHCLCQVLSVGWGLPSASTQQAARPQSSRLSHPPAHGAITPTSGPNPRARGQRQGPSQKPHHYTFLCPHAAPAIALPPPAWGGGLY